MVRYKLNRIADNFPGLEFTVTFNRENLNYDDCIGVYANSSATNDNDYGDILSPVGAIGTHGCVSVTLKSDGSRFNILSTGPLLWSSYYDW